MKGLNVNAWRKKRAPRPCSGLKEELCYRLFGDCVEKLPHSTAANPLALPGLPTASLAQPSSNQPRSGTSSAFGDSQRTVRLSYHRSARAVRYLASPFCASRWSRCTTCCFGRSCASFYRHCIEAATACKGSLSRVVGAPDGAVVVSQVWQPLERPGQRRVRAPDGAALLSPHPGLNAGSPFVPGVATPG